MEINELDNLQESQENFTGSYDAFSAGVLPGGLRNTAQIKILICFLVKNLDAQLTKDKIVDVLSSNGTANYFEVIQAFDSLCKNGSITVDETGTAAITPAGIAALNELESDIPRTIREKSLNDAILAITLERRENENNITVEKTDNGYNVTFCIENGNDTLMKLTVYAPDDAVVERMRSNFLNNPAKIYADIVSSLFA